MSSLVKIDNTWKNVLDIKTKINNSWRSIETAYVKIDGEWQPWISNVPLAPYFVMIQEASDQAFLTTNNGTSWVEYRDQEFVDQGRRLFSGLGKHYLIFNTQDIHRILVSPNAYSWSDITLGNQFPTDFDANGGYTKWFYGNDNFIIGFNDSSTTASVSNDGYSWTSITVPSDTFGNRHTFFASNNIVSISGGTFGNNINKYIYSYNGITWVLGSFPVSLAWERATFGKDIFVVTGNNSGSATATYLTSTDAINWTQRSFPSSGNWAVAYNELYDSWLATDTDRSSLAYTSLDGINWTSLTLPFTSAYSGPETVAGYFLLFDQYGSLYQSRDGVGWTLMSSSITYPSNYSEPKSIIGKYATVDKFIAPANLYIYYSEDGSYWSRRLSPVSGARSGVYANNKFVIAASSPSFVYSEDGIVWSQGSLPSSSGRNWNDIGYVGSNFVASSSDGYLAYSSDLTTWTEINPQLGSWTKLVTGTNKIIAHQLNTSTIYVSSDGVNWSYGDVPGVTRVMNFLNDRFYSLTSSYSPIYSSTDGLNWTQVGSMPFVKLWTDMAYGNNTYVAVARMNIGGSSTSDMAYSFDGSTWTAGSMPIAARWEFVSFENGLFSAFGTDSTGASKFIATSTNGISWTLASNNGINDLFLSIVTK